MAQLKGVLLCICRDLPIVDLDHNISPQDIFAAGIILGDCYRAFPSDTIPICVVDPGVGTARNIIHAENRYGRFLAPDNGVLTMVGLDNPFERIVALDNKT